MGNKHGKRRREPSVTSSQPGKPKVRLVSPNSHRRHLRETSRQRHGTAREAFIYDVTQIWLFTAPCTFPLSH